MLESIVSLLLNLQQKNGYDEALMCRREHTTQMNGQTCNMYIPI